VHGMMRKDVREPGIGKIRLLEVGRVESFLILLMVLKIGGQGTG
jgi:hypothetical protein